MTAVKLLSTLRSLGIKVWVDEKGLRYSAPRGVLTPDLRASLIERKDEVVAFLSEANRSAPLSSGLIEKVSRNGNLGLSFAQERLWFLHQLDSQTSVYNAPVVVRLTGPLNVPALEYTLNEIVRRHESLRTTFAATEGKPAQVISSDASITLRLIDLRSIDGHKAQGLSEALALKETQHPFDLNRGPLLRALLLRLGDEDHIAVLTMHHIVSDGWSMGVLVHEVQAIYAAFSAGLASPVPELDIQYADFAQWQRGWLSSEGFASQMNYWKQRLGPVPPLLELPTDKPRPEIQTYNGAHHIFGLSPELSRKLKAFSQAEDGTLFMAGLGAFQALLYHYCKQDVITVGTTIANRSRPELERLIGFFANIIIFCADLSGDPSFREFFRRVRRETLDAYMHQDVPFEKLVEELQPERNLSRIPLVQVGFSLQNAPMQGFRLPGLEFTQMQLQGNTSKFDLTLVMWEEADEFGCSFEYNTDLFEAPTIAGMADHYTLLLESALADPETKLSSLLPTLQSSSINKPHRNEGHLSQLARKSNLTRNQLLMWMGQILEPETAFYNMVVTFRIPLELDLNLFNKAFEQLLHSSDALRTVIFEEEDVPQQRTLDLLPGDLQYLDFSASHNALGSAQDWMMQNAPIPFDLHRSMIESSLIRLADADYVWYLKIHHLVIDLWSEFLNLERLSYYYGQAVDEATEAPALLPSFEDFVEFERNYRTSPEYQKAEAYWDEKLSRKLEPLILYGRTPVKKTTNVRRVFYTIRAERADNLRKIAAREDVFNKTLNVTMFNIFASALLAYLHRISLETHLSLGTPFHNRRLESFKKTIGLFMEVLPLRVTIEERDSFLSLIKKISADATETLKHSLCAIGNPTQNKAYEIFLNYNAAPKLSFCGAPVEFQWLHAGQGSDSLALQVHDYGPSKPIELMFDFHCDVFDDDLQKRAIEHFQTVISALIEDIEQPVRYVRLLTREEEKKTIEDFNKAEIALPENTNIIDLFEGQAAKAADRIALVFGDHAITYGELNARANQLAHLLRAMGIGAEARIGVCVERSPEMIIAVLAVMKSGGAYVPLDPTYPAERLAYMLEDAGIQVLLATTQTTESLPDHKVAVLFLDTDWPLISAEDKSNPSRISCVDSLAYVIYTSGSTGKAKGVQVSHRNLVNAYLAWQEAYELLTPESAHLQMASFSFDVFSGDLVRALCSGARLVLCPWEWLLDAENLYKLILDQRIDCGEFVPAVIRNLVEKLKTSNEHTRFLRLMIVGSDSWYAGEFESLQNICGKSVRVINSYGVAEATIDSSYFEGELIDDETSRMVPIGRPFSNTRLYVMDFHMNPTPPGMPGELYIGGTGVARGYLNRPELTAARFVPDPFSKKPGARLYRTGDLARHLIDANIEFLGRLDNQIKVRGFRIEPGEVEAAVKDHPQVRDAVVIAAELEPSDKTLIAYVVGDQHQPVPADSLRHFLKQRLADYMIPSVFVMLDSLPLTPNGKVDRKALPVPSEIRRESSTQYLAPRTEVEQTITIVWQEVLRVEKIGVNDNFFDLGGHSLLIVQIHSRLRTHFSEKLTIVDLFKYPTISALAEYLSRFEEGVDSTAQQDRDTKIKEGKSRLQHQLKLSRRAAKE